MTPSPARFFPLEIMRNLNIWGYTLGCRLNSYETDAIVEQIIAELHGVRAAVQEEADIIVVNTCAVTGKSQARSRKAVRTFLTRNPHARIIVTGCVAEVFPGDFTDLDGERVTVVPNAGKGMIPGMLSGTLRGETPGLFPSAAPLNGPRTRAFLKIQDGCDNRCAYCIVPIARGPSRSQPRELVIQQAGELARAGYREISLTGVDIADYGSGLYSDYGLPELILDLLDIGGFRIRVGSVEPLYLSTAALEKIAVPGVCSHFHIPFQSGSDRILSEMGRNYGRARENELLAALTQLFPGVCLGCDIIAGFPGETEEDFQKSMELADDQRIAYLHVFPYSPRPGTPAASMEQVHTETVTDRAVQLREVSSSSRKAFRKRMLGTVQTVLVEGRAVNGRKIGLSGNYIPVYAPEGASEGDMAEVVLTEDDVVWGQR